MRFFWMVVFCVASLSARADIKIEAINNILNVAIKNTITELDANALREVSEEVLARSNVFVVLDSTGGDVSAAMQIGRLIRKHEATTVVMETGSKCHGSCALIFIAGVVRLNFGSIGLHRPYPTSAPKNRQSSETQIPLMQSQIKSYVAEMGITEDFYQRMANTEPSQMAIYSSSDVTTVVPEKDPVFDEVNISYQARQYGIPIPEMRQRDKNAERCRQLRHPAFFECVEATHWGLVEDVFRERFDRSSKTCLPTDEEMNILKGLSRKEFRDHHLYIKNETCRRNIMLGR